MSSSELGCGSRTDISRVLYPSRDGDHLSWTPVARRLQRPIPEGSASSLIPEGTPSYLVLLRAGFAWPAGHPAAGGLLPHHFTLTRGASLETGPPGGVISVALSFGSPRLGVTQRPALWSPDFPPTLFTSPAVTRPPRPGSKSTHGCSRACVGSGRPGTGRR